ncbi:HlyD family secretion protein [Hoylesella marshii]|uniref:Auxiliary transport protein, membrane fusion protein (MFP) family protein n=1 Tax=Hoylesella marshii DSM 16973 = JCM 13450 TaxID=862515 RepID=E0NVL4_9BACT|nr:HlyD family efflux transporter periplasmic adaptor subunit [Hoylesella marshii]EFM00948.1 auxiliary transport protein, membrane fusion protein (MFP) family protein [Hoylesella marshii DSM 16973 = JCM 13450]
MKRTILLLPFMALALLTACGNRQKDYDATGLFEATEVTVSAEQSGRLIGFDVMEGSRLQAAEQVGLIDTVPLMLKARQLGATRAVYANQRPDLSKQIATLREQLSNAEMERRRFAGLVADGAASRKQLDDADNAVRVLRRQLEAQISAIGNSTQSLNSQMTAADIQRAEVIDQLQKCHVRAPIAGTVLETYAERGEFAVVGKPLFKMADTDRMFLRAYITSEQLSSVKIGQRVRVTSDYGHHAGKTYSGIVVWISDRSEFTPKTIVTDDERADLVYAVKIAVRNDGGIKIGMYGKVKF